MKNTLYKIIVKLINISLKLGVIHRIINQKYLDNNNHLNEHFLINSNKIQFKRENFDSGLLDQNKEAHDEHHTKTIKRIIVSYHSVQEAQKNIEEQAYKINGAWKNFTKEYRYEYFEALNSKNIEKTSKLLTNFFRNQGVNGLWSNALFDDMKNNRDISHLVNKILTDYRTLLDLVGNKLNLSELAIPSIGNPWGYYYKNVLLNVNSCRHYYYANHVNNLLKNIKEPVVCEIGGGYGGFAYYFLASKEDKRTYIGIDISEILPVIQYFMIKAFPNKKILLYGENKTTRISNKIIKDYDIILFPHFTLPTIPNLSSDLIINTGSLSEMDYTTVEEYIKQISRTTKKYFFHSNSDAKILNADRHIEIPASDYPIPEKRFKKIYKAFTHWNIGSFRMREYLYEKI